MRHYKTLGVRDFGVWNEENHKSQPTYKNARRAATYYRTMRKICRGCTIVALDVLDQRGVQGYISRWFRALPRSTAHKKTDHRHPQLLRHQPHALARHVGDHPHAQALQPPREVLADRDRRRGVLRRRLPVQRARAASRISYMFKLARKFRHASSACTRSAGPATTARASTPGWCAPTARSARATGRSSRRRAASPASAPGLASACRAAPRRRLRVRRGGSRPRGRDRLRRPAPRRWQRAPRRAAPSPRPRGEGAPPRRGAPRTAGGVPRPRRSAPGALAELASSS